MTFVNLGLTPYSEKVDKTFFFVFSETRPYLGEFWENFVFFPLGGRKHLEKFPKNENKVYRDKGGVKVVGWGGVGGL